MFLPKKDQQLQRGGMQLSPEESEMFMRAKMAAYQQANAQSTLPQTPIADVQQIPLVMGGVPPVQNSNFEQPRAISSHMEAMARQEQLDKIPVQNNLGLNGIFPGVGPTQNTVNPYAEMQNRQRIQMRYPPQSIHNFERIIDGASGEQVRPSSQPQQVLQRQSPYSQATGYSTNPYANGSVI